LIERDNAMKLSISIVDKAGDMAPFVLRGDFSRSIRLAKTIGYDAVEMHVTNPESIDINEIRDLCERESISVSSIGTGMARTVDGLSFVSNDRELRTKTAERMKSFIKAAQTLGSVVIIGLIKGLIPPGEDYHSFESRVVDMLNICLEEAEKRGVTLVLEAINRYESNFLVNADETLAFIHKFKSDHLKIHLDTFHMNIEEPDMAKSIIKCKGFLGHMHFADSDRRYPGHGHIRFKEVLNALDQAGYSGYIAIECLAMPDPMETAKRTLEYLRSLEHN
jgi:sugar phosphate isomerase/epimerase